MNDKFKDNEDPRLAQMLEVIFKYAAGDLTARGALADDDSALDGVMAGINILGEELQANVAENKQAHQALSKSEALLRTIFDSVQDGIVLMDTRTRGFKMVNDSICRMLGYSSDELIELRVDDIHPEEDIDNVNRQLERQLKHEISLALSLPVKRKDGSIFYADINAIPLQVTGATFLLAVFRDITERKLAELAIKESEEKYRQLFESSHDALMVIMPPSWRFTDVNPATLQMFGAASKDEFIALEPWQLSPERQPDGRPSAETSQEKIATTLREGSSFFEWEHQRLNGEAFTADVLLARMETDGQTFVIGTVRDISERKRVEQALAESEAVLKTIFDSMQDGIIVADAKTRQLKMVNASICRMLGYSADEMLKLGVESIHPAEQLDYVICQFAQLGKGEIGIAPSVPMLRKDGSIFYADANSGPMMIDGVASIVGVFRDITERKQAEEKILTLNQALEEKVQQLLVTQEELEQHRAHLELEVAQRTASLTEAQRIAHLGNWEWDLINNTLNWSDEMYRIFGLTPQQFGANYEAFLNAVHPEDRQLVDDSVHNTLERQHPYNIDFRVLQPDGTLRYVHGQAEVMQGEDGQPISMLGTLQDITEHKQAEQALHDSKNRYRNLVETTSDWVWEVDENAAYTYVSPRAHAITGYQPAEIIGTTPFDLMVPEEAKRVASLFAPLAAAQQPMINLENIRLHKDGHPIIFESSGVPVIDADGKLCGYRGIDRDITERKQAEQTAMDERNFSNTLIASQPDVFYALDPIGRFIRWNDKFSLVLGYSNAQLAVTNALDVIYEADRPAVAQKIQEAFEQGAATIEARLITKSGIRDYVFNATSADTAKGKYLVGVGTDITERKLAEAEVQKLQEQLREQALHDPLTGLYNRRYLEESMGREIIRAERYGRPIGIVMCDLDHFKLVNDTYGHLAGDEVLKVFAELLRTHSRGSDIVCRFGGEEFLLLLPDMPPDIAYQRAEELRASLAAQQIGKSVIRVTASFGVAAFPVDGKTQDTLISAVDAAMYQAKKTGRNRVVVASAHEEDVPDHTGEDVK